MENSGYSPLHSTGLACAAKSHAAAQPRAQLVKPLFIPCPSWHVRSVTLKQAIQANQSWLQGTPRLGLRWLSQTARQRLVHMSGVKFWLYALDRGEQGPGEITPNGNALSKQLALQLRSTGQTAPRPSETKMPHTCRISVYSPTRCGTTLNATFSKPPRTRRLSWISVEQVQALIRPLAKSGYGQYLQQIIKEELR